MKKFGRNLIIAIDGHSSCGKSTIARDLAKKINFIYIDSGAMYRAITLFAMRHKLIGKNDVDENQLKYLISKAEISFKYHEEKQRNEIYLNDEAVEDEIRNLQVSNNVSLIARIQFVRKKMITLQREIGKNGGVIMDGRDIGTVVFPHADLKIFMTADIEIRTLRRFNELKEKGEKLVLDEIRENIKKRDFMDENRAESPLIKAPDAIVLNNSKLNREEQLYWIIEKMKLIELDVSKRKNHHEN